MNPPVHDPDLIERSRPLARLCRWLRDHPLFVIPLFLCAYGVASIDVGDFRVLSAAPLQLHVDPSRQFLHFSPLPFFLGYPVTRAIGPAWAFAVVMLGGLIFSAAALRRFVAVRYGSRQNDAMLMVFATPLMIVLSQYIGKSDPFMVAFLLLLVASTHPMVQVVMACLVVVSHLEMGLLVLVSAIFLRSCLFGGRRSAASRGSCWCLVTTTTCCPRLRSRAPTWAWNTCPSPLMR